MDTPFGCRVAAHETTTKNPDDTREHGTRDDVDPLEP